MIQGVASLAPGYYMSRLQRDAHPLTQVVLTEPAEDGSAAKALKLLSQFFQQNLSRP